ncbi:MAG: metallophosphoesterase family protein [Armatimonadetes bacterium]|nr:metallophosphoesterase family protein [Armatimonadota bacterium]
MSRLGVLGASIALMSTFGVATHLLIQQSPAPVTQEPTRVLLTWTADPARSATVTWRTDGAVESAVAQISVASADPRFANTAQTVNAVTETVALTENANASYHKVTFGDLQPETRYSYRVGDGKTWSEWFDFTTAAASGKPLTFIYFGDAQNAVKSMWSRVIRQASTDAPNADFMLHAGDLINIADADNEWGEWFYAGGWLHSTIPSIAVPGNHEYKGGQLSKFWKPQFEYPRNGVEGLEDTCFYIDVQGVRIIGMNSLEKRQEQAEWLEKVLSNNPNKWTMITFHYPMFSTAKGRDNKELRELWMPIIQKNQVDMVLQGHDHTYGRMNVPTGVSTQYAGTMYLVSVSGPKMYAVGDDAKSTMTRTAQNTQLYQIINVDGDLLTYKAYTAVGEVYDAFTLRKTPQGNRLTSAPGLPADRSGALSE